MTFRGQHMASTKNKFLYNIPQGSSIATASVNQLRTNLTEIIQEIPPTRKPSLFTKDNYNKV